MRHTNNTTEKKNEKKCKIDAIPKYEKHSNNNDTILFPPSQIHKLLNRLQLFSLIPSLSFPFAATHSRSLLSRFFFQNANKHRMGCEVEQKTENKKKSYGNLQMFWCFVRRRNRHLWHLWCTSLTTMVEKALRNAVALRLFCFIELCIQFQPTHIDLVICTIFDYVQWYYI